MIQEAKKLDSYSQGWIGVIPNHWSVKRLKHIARFTTGWTPPTGNAASYIGANQWANIGDLGPKVITETAKQISDEAVKNTGITISPVGSLLFSFKLSVGQVSIAGQSMFTNEAIATFHPQDDFYIQWAYYSFPEFIPENAAVNIYGAKLLNQQRINDALLPFPPKNEQLAIASYLDSETARIDALIDEKRKLIVQMIELRATVTTELLTGQNIKGSRRQTGLVEFPTVPESWQVAPLKRFVEIFDCKHITVPFIDSGFPVASIREIRGGIVDLSHAKQTDEVNWSFLREGRAPQRGDLVFVRNASVGAVGLVTTSTPFAMGQDVCLISEAPIGKFLWYVLDSHQVQSQLEAILQGSTIRRINVEQIRNFIVCWPPVDVQAEIVRNLDRETARVDQLARHVQTELDLLVEMRAATITDAVLGRIDVRSHLKN